MVGVVFHPEAISNNDIDRNISNYKRFALYLNTHSLRIMLHLDIFLNDWVSNSQNECSMASKLIQVDNAFLCHFDYSLNLTYRRSRCTSQLHRRISFTRDRRRHRQEGGAGHPHPLCEEWGHVRTRLSLSLDEFWLRFVFRDKCYFKNKDGANKCSFKSKQNETRYVDKCD